MTIANARKFIKQAQVNDDLRKQMNKVETVAELDEQLAAVGLSFTPGEFGEAYSNTLVNCQFQEQADQLQEFKMWWDLLQGYIGGTVPSSSCASSCASAGSCSSASSCGPDGCDSCG